MKPALEIVGVFLILLVVLPWVRTYRWWVRVWDFPRVQLAVTISLVATAYVWQFGWGKWAQTTFILAMFAAVFDELRRVWRFTPFWPVQALRTRERAPRHSFSLLVANVRMSNQRYARFLKLVKENDPDLVVITEPDAIWARHLSTVLDAGYPHRMELPLDNTYGLMLYSRFQLLHPRVRFLVEPNIPSFRTTVVMPAGHTFELFCVHPQPPQFLRDTDRREAELLQVAREVVATPRPSIVVGDLNDVAWSYTTNLFRRISGLVDPRIGRGFFNTYNAFVPFFRYSLDHIFYSPTFRLMRLKRLGFFGSDHFPMLIRLNYEPTGAHEHEVPEPDHEEVAEAHEMIRDGLETARQVGTADGNTITTPPSKEPAPTPPPTPA